MTEPCPYCGGDESKCDFDYKTDRCSEMERRSAERAALTSTVRARET